MENKTWVFADVHGNYKALKQVFERSGVKEGDTIISLGDLVDGLEESYEVLDFLVHCNLIYNIIYIRGNHCDWFRQWLDTGINPVNWQQGQLATAKSYLKQIGKEDLVHIKSGGGYIVALNPDDIPQSHINIFKSQVPYYIDDNNNLFIHGGFNRHFLLKNQLQYTFWWDRDLFMEAMSFESMNRGALGNDIKFKMKEKFNNIFIGHTCTQFFKSDDFIKAANIYNIDTGAGHRDGRLCMMNVDTKEAFYSDYSRDLYPEYKGRS